MGPQQTSGMTPWVRRLIVANLVVFLLQETIFLNPGLPATLGFVPLAVVARPWTAWTAVTYMFVHGNFLHLAFNLLALFVFGRAVEERMGSGPFLAYYLLCGLGGAALSFLLIQFTPVSAAHPIIGASAAVYGVLLAFAWAWPDQPIYVFPLPHPIPAKWLVTFVVALSLVPAILPGAGAGVAYLAHLGGFATGFLYLKTADWRLGRAERQLRRAATPSVLVHPGRAARASAAVKPRAPARTPAQAEVDRVLDKISARGIESLTPAERRFLSEMSRKMRDKT